MPSKIISTKHRRKFIGPSRMKYGKTVVRQWSIIFGNIDQQNDVRQPLCYLKGPGEGGIDFRNLTFLLTW